MLTDPSELRGEIERIRATRGPGNWIRLSEAARRLQVHRQSVWTWAKRGLVASRRIGRRLEVPIDGLASFVRSWGCSGCPFRSGGPQALKGHLEFLHASSGLRPERRIRWVCPSPDCEGSRGFRDADRLAKHLEEHIDIRRRAGIAERRNRGRPASAEPRPPCKEKGCEAPATARRVCMKHYQRMRRAQLLGKKRS